jgi:hypothetical protein
MKAISLGGGGLLASAAPTHGAKVNRAMRALSGITRCQQKKMRKKHLIKQSSHLLIVSNWEGFTR